MIIRKSLDIYHQKTEIRDLRGKIEIFHSTLDPSCRDDEELLRKYLGMSYSSQKQILVVKKHPS